MQPQPEGPDRPAPGGEQPPAAEDPAAPPGPEAASGAREGGAAGEGAGAGAAEGAGASPASEPAPPFAPDSAPSHLASRAVDPDLQRRIRKRTAHGIGIYVICAIDYFLVFIHRLATAALGDELEQRFPGLGSEGRGLFASLYFYLYAVAQPFCGIIVDLAKPRWTITTASGVMALGSVIIGCVPNLGVAYFGRALVGLGAAFIYVPILKMTSLWFTPKRFALLAALMIAMGGLGGFLATIPLTALIDALKRAFGGDDPISANYASNAAFMSLFVGLGVLSCIVAVVMSLVARDSPEQAGHPSLSVTSASLAAAPAPGPEAVELTEVRSTTDQHEPLTRGAASSGASSGASSAASPASGAAGTPGAGGAGGETLDGTASAPGSPATTVEASRGSRGSRGTRGRARSGPSAGQLFVSSMKEVFTTKGTVQLVLLMIGFFFFSGSYFTISASLGIDLLRNVVGLSPSTAALVQGCMNLATAAYGPVESVLADRFGRKRPYVANYAINVVIYLLLGIGCMYYRAAWYFIVLFLAIGAVPGTGIAIAYTMTQENFSLALGGTSVGVFNIAPFLGGALFQNISPLLIAAGDLDGPSYKGYANMFWLLMSANVAGLLLAVFTKDTKPQAV